MIKSFIFIISLLLVSYIFSSCDCGTVINGYVLDTTVNEAVENAHVYLEIKKSFSRTYIKDDLGIQEDTISITDREEYIRRHGNKEGWIDIYHDQNILYKPDRMTKNVPLKTDFYGSFKIMLMSNRCPDYKLYIEKEGYETLIVERNEIIKYPTELITFKLKKKSGA